MAERKDPKGRKLRTGEYYDKKTGRYLYKYSDASGSRHTVYSWTLTPADSAPKGKPHDLCLREKEQQITKDLIDGIEYGGAGMTVYELCCRYISIKSHSVRETTRTGYKTVMNILAKEEFGEKRIDKVKVSDAKKWLIKLQQVDGRSYSSIHTIRGVLRPAFALAVEDDLIRRNPFSFELVEVVVNDSVRRDAISRKDMRRFLDFAKNDRIYSRYYYGFFILFHTGLRISEFCGLTKEAIDFENGVIHVRWQLLRNTKGEYYIAPPKTEAGTRDIPMSSDVAEAFRRVIEQRPELMKEMVVWDERHKNSLSGFLFISRNKKPEVALHWINHFRYGMATLF